MEKGLSGSGGVDQSSLNGLMSKLNEILNKQTEINAKKVKPTGDDSGLIPVRKSLETIREEVEKTGSVDIDFLNTKVIKKSVSNALSELERIKKTTKGFENDIKDIGTAKSFINNYKLLEEYGKRFGKDFVGEYRKIFNEITEEGSHVDLGFDISGLKTSEIDKLFDEFQEKIKNITERASESAKSTVNMEISYATEDYFDSLAKERKQAYDIERQAAIESVNAVKQAEREKQEALMETRDELVNGVKEQLDAINSLSGEGQFLQIDYDEWGKFQKSAGDMIQVLAKMGVEVREVEDLLDSISKKVYIPKDQFSAAKHDSVADGVVGDISELDKARQKVEELYNEISRLQNELNTSLTNEAYDELHKDYEEARQEVERLKVEIENLNIELRNSVDFFTWDRKCEEVERLEKEIDNLKNKLKSTGDVGREDLSEEMLKGFNSEELTSFLNVLERIEQQLRNISSTLGTVDENSGFNNMISSIDILLSKLDEMHKKIGTGIYNINVNQGSDETTFAQDESVKSYIRDTQNRYKSAYDKVVQKAGGEELLFTRINNILNVGIDELSEAYSSINLSKIESKEQQIYRLMDFFKLLRQAMSDENFGLNLKGIRLPSSDDENFRRMIKEKSGEADRKKKQRVKEGLLSDEPEESLPGLNQITQALERIEALITEISQKDLFGDSLLKVSEQLDEISEKFNNIVSEVRVINDSPIVVTNQNGLSSNKTPVSSVSEQRTEALKEEEKQAERTLEAEERLENNPQQSPIYDSLDGEKNKVDEIVDQEKAKFEDLAREIDTAIPEAINKKNEAFDEELTKVSGIVEDEIVKLRDLENELDNVKDHLKMDVGDSNSNSGSGRSRKKGNSNSNGYDDNKALKIADAIENEIDKQINDIDGVITSIDRAYDSHDNLVQALIRVERNITDEDGKLAKQAEYLNVKYDKKGDVAYTSRKESDNYKAAEAERAKETSKAEKESLKQAQEIERQRQALYKQMQKASSDKKSAQEKQRQSEINAVLTEQKNAYQKVWDIRKQIVRLDPNKNKEEVAELEQQKKLALDVYAERTKELKILDEIANSEAQNNTLLEIRQKAINEISVIEARLRDKGANISSNNVGKSNTTKDNTAKYTNLIANRRILEGDLNAATIRNDQNAIKYSKERISALDKEIQKLEKLGNIDKKASEASIEAEMARIKAAEKASKADDAQAKRAATNLNRQTKMTKDFSLWLSRNGAAAKEYANEISLIFEQLQKQGNLTAEELNNVQREINSLMATAAREGKTGSTFMQTLEQRFRSLGAYLASFASFYDVVGYVREALNAIISVDTAITELRKVSNATDAQLSQSFKNSDATAKELGASITDVINSTSDWSRNGFNIPDAEELARVTTLYQNVGDNISQEEASQSLISTLRGFKMEASEAESIIDSFNEVANNFAIDSKGIGEALQRSAASFKAANTDMNSSIALITATNTVLQDPERVGNMWKTVSARIRGASTELKDLGEETDEYVESTSKMRDLIKGMTGFDIMEDEKTFKDMKDIIIGIGKAFEDLDDIDQTALIEAMAGKTQSNALAAALQNVDIIEQAYETAENSAGSAMREQENYQKSIQYSLDVMKASAQSWATSLVDSGVVKWFVDLGNAIINASDKFGSLNTLLTSGTVIGELMLQKKGLGLTIVYKSPFIRLCNNAT